MLKELDISHILDLDSSNSSLKIDQMPNLVKLYAAGTNISHILFTEYGLIEEINLPATLESLQLKNLYFLKTVNLDDKILY
jgi:hypothetical protein